MGPWPSALSAGWVCRREWAADGQNGERLHDETASRGAVPVWEHFLVPRLDGESIRCGS